jgi:hypothetical protein
VKKDILALIIAGLAYSMMAIGYVHAQFPSKDSFQMVLKELQYIRNSLDDIRGK